MEKCYTLQVIFYERMITISTDNQDTRKLFLWLLFKSTFLISAFTVGGGMVLIPLMKAKFVDEYHWIDDKETLDLVAIAQSLPGIMACNSAIMLGYRMGGLTAALTALLATVLPPLIFLTIISIFYDAFASNEYVQMILKGMQCGATAIIINVVIGLLQKQLKKKLVLPMVILVGTFIANYFFGINLMYCILVDAIIGALIMREPKYND